MNLQHTAGPRLGGMPVDPALTATQRPLAFARPARQPVAAEECGDAAAREIEDRHTAIVDRHVDRAKSTDTRRHADNALPGEIEKQIELVTSQPAKEPTTAG